MGTWNGFYIRGTPDHRAASKLVRMAYPKAILEEGSVFLGVWLSPYEYTPPEQLLGTLSSHLHTDVLWLSFQSLVDAFQFHHWRDGVYLRALVYGCYKDEHTWEHVEGTPEPWERQVFFGDDGLRAALEYAPLKEVSELKRIWREGEIAAGRTEPSLNSRGCAHEIAAFYGLPHYTVQS